ncbi:putative protein OS=Stutzerimonas stutzeri OX=316 GN=E5834_20180 PE=4 SV=1 [Stutzerimonas stutzeri]
MPRTDLSVPFAEKDDAKRLGARWDAERKLWFAPDGVDLAAFARWLPTEPEITIRSPRYFIAQTEKDCWSCGQRTGVLGFILPEGHECLEPDEDDEDEDKSVWVPMDCPTIVHYVRVLLPEVAVRAQALNPRYRVDFSQTIQASYWMNHCEHCEMKQGDFEMYSEPQGAFFPLCEDDAALITLHEIAEPFGCDASAALGEMFIDAMQRA